jgi:hypothetical protein
MRLGRTVAAYPHLGWMIAGCGSRSTIPGMRAGRSGGRCRGREQRRLTDRPDEREVQLTAVANQLVHQRTADERDRIARQNVHAEIESRTSALIALATFWQVKAHVRTM